MKPQSIYYSKVTWNFQTGKTNVIDYQDILSIIINNQVLPKLFYTYSYMYIYITIFTLYIYVINIEI